MSAFFAQVQKTVEAGAPVVAGATIFTWMAGILPTVAALFSIIWLGMQMIIHWDKFAAAVKRIIKRKG